MKRRASQQSEYRHRNVLQSAMNSEVDALLTTPRFWRGQGSHVYTGDGFTKAVKLG
jgi:hypothetical protein